MPAFASGQIVTAAQLNSAAPIGESQSATNITPGTTTSTAYVSALTGTTAVTLAFTAPPSGQIEVVIQASMKHSATNGFPAISFTISGSAGTVAASDDNQAFHQSANVSNIPEMRSESTTQVTGLTPGATGTITMVHKVTVAGTGTFNFRRIKQRPIAA